MDGWRAMKISLPAYVNHDLQKKVLVYNSHPSIRGKMLGVVKEFVSETRALRQARAGEDVDST